jgi:hypothetical protein
MRELAEAVLRGEEVKAGPCQPLHPCVDAGVGSGEIGGGIDQGKGVLLLKRDGRVGARVQAELLGHVGEGPQPLLPAAAEGVGLPVLGVERQPFQPVLEVGNTPLQERAEVGQHRLPGFHLRPVEHNVKARQQIRQLCTRPQGPAQQASA